VLPQVALSLLCKTKIYILFTKTPIYKCLPSVCYTYFSGLPAFGSSPAKQQSVWVLKDFQDYATIPAYPINPKIGGIVVQTIFTAALTLALIFTLSCSGSDDNNDGSTSSNLSDLPKQAYIVVKDGDGNRTKNKYEGNSDITLSIQYCDYSCSNDETSCTCIDYDGNEHECEYDNNRYEDKPAGKIENGQVKLNLPYMDSKYLKNVKICADDEGCNVSVIPENLAWFTLYYYPRVTISGNSNCWIEPVLIKSSDFYYDSMRLVYSSQSGEITGTSTGGHQNYDLKISKGWNAYYRYNANADRYYTSDISKIGGTFEWWINCDD
jgi:hypothetical protein